MEIDKEEYIRLCKYRRYVHNWHWNFTIYPKCGEFNPNGYVCLNCSE